MQLRRGRPKSPVRLVGTSAPPPCAVSRAAADAAVALLTAFGADAAEQARLRAGAALRRENLWTHARWGQAERLIHALDRWPDAADRH